MKSKFDSKYIVVQRNVKHNMNDRNYLVFQLRPLDSLSPERVSFHLSEDSVVRYNQEFGIPRYFSPHGQIVICEKFNRIIRNIFHESMENKLGIEFAIDELKVHYSGLVNSLLKAAENMKIIDASLDEIDTAV